VNQGSVATQWQERRLRRASECPLVRSTAELAAEAEAFAIVIGVVVKVLVLSVVADLALVVFVGNVFSCVCIRGTVLLLT
jgi:hypothetical protein